MSVPLGHSALSRCSVTRAGRTPVPLAAVSLSLDLSRDPEGGFVDWAWGNVLFLVSTINSTLNRLVEDGWTNIV